MQRVQAHWPRLPLAPHMPEDSDMMSIHSCASTTAFSPMDYSIENPFKKSLRHFHIAALDRHASIPASVDTPIIDSLDSYRGKPLGKGSVGYVMGYTVNHKDRMVNIAVKKPNPDVEDSYHYLNNEIKTLRNLDHTNVLTFVEGVESDECPVLVTLQFSTDLYRWLENGNPANLRNAHNILRGILSGMSYLHDFRNTHHNDLHPPNILLQKGRGIMTAVISDFSSATKKGDDHMTFDADTRHDPLTYTSGTDRRDLYSIGYITCCLFSGRQSMTTWTESGFQVKSAITNQPPENLVSLKFKGADRQVAIHIIEQIAFPSLNLDSGMRYSAIELKDYFKQHIQIRC